MLSKKINIDHAVVKVHGIRSAMYYCIINFLSCHMHIVGVTCVREPFCVLEPLFDDDEAIIFCWLSEPSCGY